MKKRSMIFLLRILVAFFYCQKRYELTRIRKRFVYVTVLAFAPKPGYTGRHVWYAIFRVRTDRLKTWVFASNFRAKLSVKVWTAWQKFRHCHPETCRLYPALCSLGSKTIRNLSRKGSNGTALRVMSVMCGLPRNSERPQTSSSTSRSNMSLSK